MAKRYLVQAIYKSSINEKHPLQERLNTIYSGKNKEAGIRAFNKFAGGYANTVGRVYILDETLEFEPPILKRIKHS